MSSLDKSKSGIVNGKIERGGYGVQVERGSDGVDSISAARLVESPDGSFWW